MDGKVTQPWPRRQKCLYNQVNNFDWDPDFSDCQAQPPWTRIYNRHPFNLTLGRHVKGDKRWGRMWRGLVGPTWFPPVPLLGSRDKISSTPYAVRLSEVRSRVSLRVFACLIKCAVERTE